MLRDRIFTAQDDFTAAFTHGYGQVLDFQRWVDDDVSYARRSMAQILVHRGMLVIGRRADIRHRQGKTLARLVALGRWRDGCGNGGSQRKRRAAGSVPAR